MDNPSSLVRCPNAALRAPTCDGVGMFLDLARDRSSLLTVLSRRANSRCGNVVARAAVGPTSQQWSAAVSQLKAPLDASAIHLCVDMQRLFSAQGPWPTPWMARVLPAVLAMVEHAPAKTVFTRFIPPLTAADAPGRWQAYYRKWAAVTRERIDPALLDLLPRARGARAAGLRLRQVRPIRRSRRPACSRISWSAAPTRSSSPVRRPTSACSPPCSRRSIVDSASSWCATASAARRMKRMTRC